MGLKELDGAFLELISTAFLGSFIPPPTINLFTYFSALPLKLLFFGAINNLLTPFPFKLKLRSISFKYSPLTLTLSR
ncbi:hypothetical protein Sjap_001932 [Stephania japonica]|uniref:Uncharacterized protein n=1 Tax=Stephania japonica TaxID=461633 RepID=A0AAP0KKV0_9MAGN